MKIARGHIFVVSTLILAFLCLAIREAEKRLSVPEKYVCMFDTRLSSETKKQIRLFVEHTDKSLLYVMSRFDVTMQQQFPFIRSLQTRIVPPATMKIICTAYDPCYDINSTNLIAIAHGQAILCPAHAYKKEICDNLPHITVDDQALNGYKAQELYTMLSQLPQDIYALYHVHITAHNTIMLLDAKQPNLTLVTRSGCDMTLLEKCGTYVRELLESRKAFSGKSAARYTADLRFEKHIILSKNLKEE